MSAPVVQSGAIVAWWEGGALTFGIVAGEEKQRLRLVLARGKEQRVKPSRIVLEVAAPGRAPGESLDERRAAGERVAAVESRIRKHAEEIDVPLLWELSGTQLAESGQPCSIRELAELALASGFGDAQAAVMLALHEDDLHFARGADTWEPRPGSAVEDLQQQRARIRQREEETATVFGALAAAVRGEEYRETGLELERRALTALEQVAVFEDAASEPDMRLALTALRAAGVRFDRPHAGAFELLRRVGRFTSDDQNLQLLRLSIEPEFPTAVLAAAEREALEFDRAGRVDLTKLETISIDSLETKEVDDLLSVEPLARGGARIGVHIAEPGAFVEPGSVVDREALARGLTHYMPDLKILMLPPVISEQAASLLEGQDRPALSFFVEVGQDGEIVDYTIERSLIRSSRRFDYDRIDRILEAGSGDCFQTIAALDRMAQLRQQARIRAGAVVIDAPEVEVLVGADGVPRLSRLPSGSAARRMVTELMVLAGAVAATFCCDADVPAVYRRQAAPSGGPGLSGLVDDPVTIRAARRSLRRAETGLDPGRHASLGLEAYVQVTSPLRRYQDLTLHRQLVSALDGKVPHLDADELRVIAASTERSELAARRAERAAKDYWRLRYLEGQVGQDLEAVVIETHPRRVVQLSETLREQAMPSLTDVEPGQPVTVRIERVVPRAGLLVLRRVD